MPRTLLGDALAGDSRELGMAAADVISEDVVLIEDDDLNRNPIMRSLVCCSLSL
jgi:hypothetical protein